MTRTILHITAGSGPQECGWVVEKLVDAFRKEASGAGVGYAVLEAGHGSALIALSGRGAQAFATARTGTVRWVGQSPFRPRHRRKNWFVGVNLLQEAGSVTALKDADIRYQAIRASGPGGQHVNTTDSAVRAFHIPTGLATLSREQRSQQANKKVAFFKLQVMLADQKKADDAQVRQTAWQHNQDLERGNEVRCYEGANFKVRKR